MDNAEMVKEWVNSNDFFEDNIVRQNGLKDIYIPSSHKYPHFHINKDFVVYSETSKKHLDVCRGSIFSGDRLRRIADENSDNAYILQVCRYMTSQFF